MLQRCSLGYGTSVEHTAHDALRTRHLIHRTSRVRTLVDNLTEQAIV